MIPKQTICFFKNRLNLDQISYLDSALTDNIFQRPTADELLYETHLDTTYTLYFKKNYYQRLRSEIQQDFDNGRFANSSTLEEWNILKNAVEDAVEIDLTDTGSLNSYLINIIEDITPQTRVLVMNSSKISSYKDFLSFLAKTVDKSYNIEVHLSDITTKITFIEVSSNEVSIIEDLNNVSVGEGGMMLSNKVYTITIEWYEKNVSIIDRISVVNRNEKVVTDYFNE